LRWCSTTSEIVVTVPGQSLRALLLLASVTAAGCGDADHDVLYAQRSSCLGCHRPLQPDGFPAGIEEAHPAVEGQSLTCTRCHGGDNESRAQSTAHVPPPPAASDLASLTHGELDAVDPEYLRFRNPGDLRVADKSCGGVGCHDDLVANVRSSSSATMAREIAAARWRAGRQDSSSPAIGLYEQEGLRKLIEPIVTQEERRIGPFLELYITKTCLGCHLWSYGDRTGQLPPRSSGCSACHIVFADDGLSQSNDPMIDKGERNRPRSHVIVKSPPTATCEGCHRGGSRIGSSYLGVAPDGSSGPATPPDLHHDAGMTCAQCHGADEVHGAGGEPPTCEGCHEDPSPQAHDADHATLACDSCHSGWAPSCYGCHVEVDMAGIQRSQLDGRLTNGWITETPGAVDLDSLVLMVDGRGRIAPSMPGQRLFFSARDGEGALVIDREVRKGRDGRPGMGQRAVRPHTVQRMGAWAACSRCHPTASFGNEDRVYEAIGIGTGRRTDIDGDGATWDLVETSDARTGESRVMAVLGGPLPADVVERMLSVTAP
jgi:hypothetical protein